ncbi:Mor family transcription activator [Paenibacillus sp. 32O-W]|jgi:Mor family transcriptional regulator|uniref:Mor transcription activator domain-containing protein n=1 Tax=Paenibacillus cisolokensis TaxID=1658519 RepID=A0ABQ4NFA8_9BACL|nr:MULTISPECIES: CD3324 family protein [Paenibacillus]ALS26334.1 Mor family transcription activator [Paenibacillus sp. 32O-W]GIQ66648.1 hypothetical protein PACILC2_52160 [Paenibacillus cisolokensis]
MGHYKNGRDVLPPSLLQELQKYIDGELIYIPKKNDRRAKWGELSGTRKLIARRNEEIWRSYRSGCSIAELERRYHLSEDSIRKIISKTRNARVSES